MQVDRRSAGEITLADLIVQRNLTGDPQVIAAGELADRLGVLLVSKLVGDGDYPRHAELLAQLRGAPPGFERFVIRFEHDDEGVHMPSSSAAEMFESGLHVDNGDRMFRLHHSAEQMPHRGMGPAHSAGTGMIDASHEE